MLIMLRTPLSAAGLLFLILASLSTTLVGAIKFDLPAATHPHTKCIWNYALSDSLVIVTASTIAKEPFDFAHQRVDVEVVDGSKHNNVYLSKKNIKGETRLAINTHSHADLGVCFKNTLLSKSGSAGVPTVTIDLDVDIGADAVDYNAIANQESLSGLETEMRKLEAVANEIVNEMEYLKKRELRMADTNRKYFDPFRPSRSHKSTMSLTRNCIFSATSLDQYASDQLRRANAAGVGSTWCLASLPPAQLFQAQIPHRLIFVPHAKLRCRHDSSRRPSVSASAAKWFAI